MEERKIPWTRKRQGCQTREGKITRTSRVRAISWKKNICTFRETHWTTEITWHTSVVRWSQKRKVTRTCKRSKVVWIRERKVTRSTDQKEVTRIDKKREVISISWKGKIIGSWKVEVTRKIT